MGELLKKQTRAMVLSCRQLGNHFSQAAAAFKFAHHTAEKLNNITIALESAQQPPHHARKSRGFSGHKRYGK